MEPRRCLLLASFLPLFFSGNYLASQSHPVALPSAANAVGSSPSTSILNASTDYTGANGAPAFDASCAVIGARLPGVSGPTGQVIFKDDTANKVLASLSLGAPAFGMIPTSVASLGQVTPPFSAIASADFNNDGFPDLALPMNSTGLAIVLNNGKGSFGAPVPVNATYAYQVITADLNGDGNLDLIGSSGSGNAISILLGKGDGSFQAETILSVDPNTRLGFATGLAAGDFNGDGKQDLAVGIANTLSTGALAILFGNGDGTFKAPVIHQIPGNPSNGTVPYPSRLLAGFLNNDTREDLLVLDFENGADPTVLLSNADGTFQASALASDSTVAVMSDFNADGFPDIATLSQSKLTVFLNNGNAQFTAATYPSSSDGYLATGDFNGDGKADFISTIGSDFGQLYLGNGDGTFQPPSQFPTNFSLASQLVAADFNHDGFYDLATLSNDPGIGFEAQLLISGRSATAYATGLSVTAGYWTSQNVTCHYSGDANYTASISNDLSFLFQQALAPNYYPAPGTYSTAQTVNILGSASQAVVNYTTDGSTPTLSSPIYTGPINVTQTETIKAIESSYDEVVSPVSQAVYTIALTPASFSFSPTSLAFPSTYLNVASAPQTLTITNTGSIAATVKSYTFSGSGASQFSIAGKTCGTSLAGEASCTLSIAFKPVTGGTASANFVATDSASGSPQAVQLTGTGSSLPNLAFSPTSLTFPSTTIGATSASQVLTVKNTSPFTMTVNSYTFGGANASEFSLLAKTCSTSLAANSNCTLTIAFKPTTASTASATLIATDNATGSPQHIGLGGTGAPKPILAFSPANISFPVTKMATTSSPQELTVSNTSSYGVPMTVSSYTFSGANASEFSLLSKTCTGSLAPSSSCTLTIVFKPTVSGPATASLLATDNAAGSPQAVPLTGTTP